MINLPYKSTSDLEIMNILDQVKSKIASDDYKGFMMCLSSKDGIGVSRTGDPSDTIRVIYNIVNIMAVEPDPDVREKFFDDLYEMMKVLYGESMMDEYMSSGLDKVIV